MAILIKILLVSSLGILAVKSCSKQSDKQKWSSVVSYFLSDSLETRDYFLRISGKAIKSIVKYDTSNSRVKVRDFFSLLSERNDYSFITRDSMLYVSFDSKNRIATGPTIEIHYNGDYWVIEDIRFGK